MTQEQSAGSRFYFYLGLGLVTAGTLALEITQTRLLSVVIWYHLAFFVISMAMFGMTLGALRVFLSPGKFNKDNTPERLSAAAFWTAVAVGLAYLDQISLAPATVFSAGGVVVFARLALTLAAPFYFSGVCVTLALTRSPYPIGATYGADLVGAAAGCVLVIPLLSLLDGPGAVFACGAVIAIGAWSFAKSSQGKKTGGYALVCAGVMIAIAIGNGMTRFGLDPVMVKGEAEKRHNIIYEKWNSFSRIAAFKETRKQAIDSLWSASPNAPLDPVQYIQMNIDGVAGTRMYKTSDDLSKMDFLLYDTTAIVHGMRKGSVAVVGVGGGRDLTTALAAGNDRVLGIEINPAFVAALEGPFRDYAKLADRPQVRLVTDEARSYLARSTEKFDILQMSLIDTWAATGAGAFALSENSLYTVEAWRIAMDRLAEDGIFTVSRWHAHGQVDETARLVSLAMGALFSIGAQHPADHLLLAAHKDIATLLLSRKPFSPEDLQRFYSHVEKMGFQVLLAPGRPIPSDLYQALFEARSMEELVAIADRLPMDLSPPTDSRPFFFNLLRLSRPWELFQYVGRPTGVVTGNLMASVTLLTIIAIVLALGAATIVIPARLSPPGVARPGAAFIAYFALIGLGFMFTEIAFLQRLSVFLGHPVYSLAVVLFSLILFTGIGSFASDRVVLASMKGFVPLVMLQAGYIACAACFLPGLTELFQASALAGRVGLSIAVLAPAGLLCGQAFPSGMRLARTEGNDPTPWLWGINGAAGVVAGALAVAISISFGITTTMICGAACYGLLAVVLPSMCRTRA